MGVDGGRWRVRRVGDLPVDARRAAEVIYLDAFPAGERVPFDDLVARDASGAARVEVVDDEGGEVVGIVASRPLGVPGWSHLEYIAVSRTRRGGGVGAAIWAAVVGRVREAGGAVLLEIENPYAPGIDAAERAVRVRRQRFYTRLGARLLRAPAVAVPDAADPGLPPIPMLLMAAPGSRAALPADAARRLVADLYRTAYGLDEGHPVVRRALASVR